MRLLIDENLSDRLPRLLSDLDIELVHCNHVGLSGKTDREIWSYARSNGFTIVTRDEDFLDLSLAIGAPPKVIYLDVPNLTRQASADILRRNIALIKALNDDDSGSVIILRSRAAME